MAKHKKRAPKGINKPYVIDWRRVIEPRLEGEPLVVNISQVIEGYKHLCKGGRVLDQQGEIVTKEGLEAILNKTIGSTIYIS